MTPSTDRWKARSAYRGGQDLIVARTRQRWRVLEIAQEAKWIRGGEVAERLHLQVLQRPLDDRHIAEKRGHDHDHPGALGDPFAEVEVGDRRRRERGLLRLPKLSELSLSAFAALRAVLIAGVLFGAIYLTYRVVVGTRAGWFRVALAALLASLGWIGASRGFSLAVPVVWKATQLYGTLGSVVLFLIWAYVIAWVLLLGGFLLVRPGRPRAASLTESGGF